MHREKDLERYLCKRVKLVLGGWALKLLPFEVRGLPDRIALLPGGRLFFAEMKETGKKPSKIQKVLIAKLRNLGFRVEVIDNKDQIDKLILDYAHG